MVDGLAAGRDELKIPSSREFAKKHPFYGRRLGAVEHLGDRIEVEVGADEDAVKDLGEIILRPDLGASPKSAGDGEDKKS